MIDYPPAVKKLISALRQLPSVGPRSAERLALHILQEDSLYAHALADSLKEARDRIKPCSRCGFFSEHTVCEVCSDPKRDSQILCVVERPADVLAIEKSATYRGLYHVLGGLLSPLDGIGPEQLSIPSLISRTRDGTILEAVLALGHDVKGETTSLYLAEELKKNGIKVTRPATGISVGTSLEYTDPQTLVHALQGRKEI